MGHGHGDRGEPADAVEVDRLSRNRQLTQGTAWDKKIQQGVYAGAEFSEPNRVGGRDSRRIHVGIEQQDVELCQPGGIGRCDADADQRVVANGLARHRGIDRYVRSTQPAAGASADYDKRRTLGPVSLGVLRDGTDLDLGRLREPEEPGGVDGELGHTTGRASRIGAQQPAECDRVTLCGDDRLQLISSTNLGHHKRHTDVVFRLHGCLQRVARL